MSSHTVTLVGGPDDGDTTVLGDPWPRYGYFTVGGETYEMQDLVNEDDPPPYFADWVDLSTTEEDELFQDVTEGEPGPTGPEGATGPAGPTGEQGVPGKSIVYRGVWAADVAYDINDIVTHNGSSWFSMIDLNLNHEPGEVFSEVNWGVLAPPGPTGPQGTPGTPGAPGATGATGATGPQGTPGSPLPVRGTVTLVTASLAANASETGVLTLAKGYRILRISADKACWVRLYTTTAKRDADSSRLINVDPTGDHGVVVEGILSAGLLGFDCSPVPQGYSMESTPSNAAPYRVTNLGSTGVVTITFTWQVQEA